MAKRIWLIGAFAALTVAQAVRAETIVFKTALGGDAEAPPVQTAGSGSATVNADPGTKQLSWQVAYSGLSGPLIGAHIHCGAPAGANAPIVRAARRAAQSRKSDPRFRHHDRRPDPAAALGPVLRQSSYRQEQTGRASRPADAVTAPAGSRGASDDQEPAGTAQAGLSAPGGAKRTSICPISPQGGVCHQYETALERLDRRVAKDRADRHARRAATRVRRRPDTRSPRRRE